MILAAEFIFGPVCLFNCKGRSRQAGIYTDFFVLQ